METYTCGICSRDSLQKTDHPTKKCPSLLSIICLSCKKSGHVEKFCPEKLMRKNPVPVTDPNKRIDRPKTAPEKTHWEIVLEELEIEEKRISNTNVSPIIFKCLQNLHNFLNIFFRFNTKLQRKTGLEFKVIVILGKICMKN